MKRRRKSRVTTTHATFAHRGLKLIRGQNRRGAGPRADLLLLLPAGSGRQKPGRRARKAAAEYNRHTGHSTAQKPALCGLCEMERRHRA